MALKRLSDEDPTFKLNQIKKQEKQSLWEWVNSILKLLVDRMKREFSVEANVGKPQVAYKETITVKPKSKTNISNRLEGRASTVT